MHSIDTTNADLIRMLDTVAAAYNGGDENLRAAMAKAFGLRPKPAVAREARIWLWREMEIEAAVKERLNKGLRVGGYVIQPTDVMATLRGYVQRLSPDSQRVADSISELCAVSRPGGVSKTRNWYIIRCLAAVGALTKVGNPDKKHNAVAIEIDARYASAMSEDDRLIACHMQTPYVEADFAEQSSHDG